MKPVPPQPSEHCRTGESNQGVLRSGFRANSRKNTNGRDSNRYPAVRGGIDDPHLPYFQCCTKADNSTQTIFEACSCNKILSLRMVNNDAIGALLGIEEKAFGEPDADVFLGLEQAEDGGLVFEIGAGRIAERIA